MKPVVLAVSLLGVSGLAGASDQTRTGVGTIASTCAPWDGPALALEVPLSGVRPPQVLHVSLYPGGLPKVGDRYPVKVQGGTGEAQAWTGRDPLGGGFVSGSVWLERFVNGKGAAGRFDLTAPDGRTLQGAFTARWKTPVTREFCG